jgi:hypothetical protein
MKRIVRESAARSKQWDKEGLSHEDRLERVLKGDPGAIGASVFPVNDKWALEWEEVEEDEDTARLIREAPDSWLGAGPGESEVGLLNHYNAIARNRGQTNS